MPPTHRRPRAIDTSMHFCPHAGCDYQGWLGLGNLRANGHPSGGLWRQLYCRACQGYFLETHGTLLHGKHLSVELIVRVLACLAEGLGIRATARVFEVDPNTVLQWLVEAAEQLQAFSAHVLCDAHVRQLQLDELYAVLRGVKNGEISEDNAIKRLERSRHWVWTAIDPESKLLLAIAQEPTYRVRGILTDGFDSTTKSMRTLFPGARLGNCLRHALNTLPKKLVAITSPVRKALRTQFHTLWYRARRRKGLRVFALAQRLRHFADHIATTAGTANGERVRRWFQEKKTGWYAVLEDPQMPVTSTLLDQAHNAMDRKLFMMKGFHHPGGSQQAFLTGLAHLYNLIPYQRRAQHARQCGVEVEGGRVPTRDWFLNVQILTSGGFR
jgi:hypothetical protein